jgi:hypothetical protein
VGQQGFRNAQFVIAPFREPVNLPNQTCQSTFKYCRPQIFQAE